MNMLVKKVIFGLLLVSAFANIQAQAQIQTTAIGRDYENLPPSEFKEFTGSTPCYIRWYKENPDLISHMAKILKDSGFNVTKDEKAACMIEITGYVTTPSKTSGSVPVNLYKVMSDSGELKNIGPALKTSGDTETGKIATNASGMARDTIDASGINTLSQFGNAMNSVNGTIVGAVVGTLVNVVSGIQSRQETPSGVVFINAVVMFDGWLPGTKRPALVLGAYAASTKPESPEALIDAGVKRVAQAIWEHTAAYDKAHGVAFTMPTVQQSDADAAKKTSATDEATTPGTHPVPSSDKPAQDTAQATGSK